MVRPSDPEPVTVPSVAKLHRLPERLAGSAGITLRRWVVADVALLARAVEESLEHLRPWMEWVAQEPLSLRTRANMMERWERDWRAGGDVIMGVFTGERVAGGCGLHRRIAADGVEIGDRTHPAFVRRGVATVAAALLTEGALGHPDINHVEIRHDEANTASGRVPRRLGFRLVEQAPGRREAPGEVGIEWRWRMTEEEWSARQVAAAALKRQTDEP